MRNMLSRIVVSMTIVVFSLSFSSITAHADARAFFKCKMFDGVKKEAMVNLASDFMKITREEGFKDHSTDLLWPMFAHDISRGTFYWVDSSPTASQSAALENFFGESEANADIRKKFTALGTCESSSLYSVTKIK